MLYVEKKNNVLNENNFIKNGSAIKRNKTAGITQDTFVVLRTKFERESLKTTCTCKDDIIILLSVCPLYHKHNRVVLMGFGPNRRVCRHE